MTSFSVSRIVACRSFGLLTDAEIEEVGYACSGWLTTGPKVQRFETQFAEAVRAHMLSAFVRAQLRYILRGSTWPEARRRCSVPTMTLQQLLRWLAIRWNTHSRRLHQNVEPGPEDARKLSNCAWANCRIYSKGHSGGRGYSCSCRWTHARLRCNARFADQKVCGPSKMPRMHFRLHGGEAQRALAEVWTGTAEISCSRFMLTRRLPPERVVWLRQTMPNSQIEFG